MFNLAGEEGDTDRQLDDVDGPSQKSQAQDELPNKKSKRKKSRGRPKSETGSIGRPTKI